MQEIETTILNAGTAADISLISLFMEADWVVKAVMLGLLFASIWSWAIIFNKISLFRGLNAQADRFEDTIQSGESLDQIYKRVKDKAGDPTSSVLSALMQATQKLLRGKQSPTPQLDEGDLIVLEQTMGQTVRRELQALERQMTFLASVGSTAPFIGLFGTVWGIMNSFTAIANAKDTSLAVVAPGIAEALFATALGLVAAIPAVIAYNKFNKLLSQYADRLDETAAYVMTLLRREAG